MNNKNNLPLRIGVGIILLNSNNINWVMDQAKSLSVEPVNAN